VNPNRKALEQKLRSKIVNPASLSAPRLPLPRHGSVHTEGHVHRTDG
jgi:hypothetical protein